MPQWSTDRPVSRDFANVLLLRVPTAGVIAGTITSADILKCPTHFAQHRTQPCEGNGCTHCLAGYPARDHAYISFVNRVTGAHRVLELTGLGAQALHDAKQKYSRLRGISFQAHRRQHRPNAAVDMEFAPDPQGDLHLPPAVDIPSFMGLLWNLGDPENPLRQNPPVRPNIRDIPGGAITPPAPPPPQ